MEFFTSDPYRSAKILLVVVIVSFFTLVILIPFIRNATNKLKMQRKSVEGVLKNNDNYIIEESKIYLILGISFFAVSVAFITTAIILFDYRAFKSVLGISLFVIVTILLLATKLLLNIYAQKIIVNGNKFRYEESMFRKKVFEFANIEKIVVTKLKTKNEVGNALFVVFVNKKEQFRFFSSQENWHKFIAKAKELNVAIEDKDNVLDLLKH